MSSDVQRRGNHGGAEIFSALADRRLAKHEPIARALRSASCAVVNEIISLAYDQICLWEKDGLCSKDYIDAWRDLLQSPAAAASMLEERSPRAAALRQNSPFVATVRKLQASADERNGDLHGYRLSGE